LRSAAPVNGAFGPERVRRVPAMAASSASTASTKASRSEKSSHEAVEILAGVKTVPYVAGPMAVGDGRRHSPPPSRASVLIRLKVASRSAQVGTSRLRTNSQCRRGGPNESQESLKHDAIHAMCQFRRRLACE
jgi:hypothetical protein